MKKKPESDITPGNEKKFRELLEASEEKYRTFFVNSPDAIMIATQDGTVYSANPAACRMLGYSEHEICSLGRKRIVDNTPQLSEALEQLRKTGKYFGELTYIKKDGTKFPVEISSSVFTNSDGRELTTIIARDISERKKTEKSLLESEARLRLASQATGFGIYSYDFVTRVTYFSDEFLTLFGILPGNTIEHNLDLLSRSFHSEDREHFIKAVKKAYDPKGIGMLDVEFRIIRPDGEIRWLKARGRTIFSGNPKKDKPLHANGLMQDITERKVIDNALKQAHDWQETIFEGSLDAIFISDKKSLLIAVNKAACDLTGYSREELLNMRIPDLHEDLDLEAYRKYHKKIFNGEKVLSEAKILRRDGVKVDTEFNNSRISISGKLYMHTTARDITERKKSETEFRSLFENSIMGISQALPDGKIIRINKAYVDMYGYPDINTMMKEMATGIQKLYSNPEDRKMVLKSLDKSGFMPPTEFELNRRNGEKFWALVGAKQVKNNSGMVMYLQAEHIDITSQKKMEKELQQSHELLEKLNQHLVNAIEEERNQIALNLHDDLGQKLTAINLDIAWLKSRIGVQSRTVREKFEEMSSMIKETIESTKRTSAFLRPAILFDLGLVSAIKSHLDSFEKQTGIKCNFYFRPEEFLLEDRLSLILYRIFQESMTNIARHAGALKADINLSVLESKIELIIKDDGSGIEKNKVNSIKSMGIAGIRERVKSVNGKITIVGVPDSGTEMRVEIPLPKVKTDD